MALWAIYRLRAWTGVVLSLACASVMSQHLDAVQVTVERADFDDRVGAAGEGYLPATTAADALNVRLWARSGKNLLSVGTSSSLANAALSDSGAVNPSALPGLGSALNSGQAAGSRLPNAWLWGVHRQLGEDSRVSLEQAWWRSGADAVSGVSTPVRSDLRLGFEFKPTSALTRYGVSRESLMRFQLSGSWSVSMRPRSGGIALALRASL